MRSLIAALEFLTIFTWPRRAPCAGEALERTAAFFPLIGLFLGLMLVLVNRLTEPIMSPALSSVTLVAFLVLLTRGLHLDGLGDTFDGLGAGGDRERILKIMDDSHTGAFGVIAIVLLLAFKIAALASLETARWRALVAAPVLGRWAMVLFGYGSQPAKPGLGAALTHHLEGKQVFVAGLCTLLVLAAALQGFGIGLMIGIAAFSLAAKKYFHRRLGGVTGDTFGAVGELAEALVLVILALRTQ